MRRTSSSFGVRITPAAASAEYKQVTVLFADAVGSTAYGERVDAEQVYAVVQRAVAVAERHRPHLAQPGDPLGVVAVGAALEERERRVREPANPVQWGHGRRQQLGQPIPQPCRAGRQLGEERELTARVGDVLALGDGRRGTICLDAQDEARVAPLELHRLAAGGQR